jgi:hypothetical protein
MKAQILESMIELVKEGQSIAATNENDFSEFADVNGYDVEEVKEVYFENEEMLTKIWEENQ